MIQDALCDKILNSSRHKGSFRHVVPHILGPKNLTMGSFECTVGREYLFSFLSQQ